MLRKCPHRTGADDGPVEEQSLSDAEITQSVVALVTAVDGLDERERAESAIDIAIANDDVSELDEQVERLDRGDNAAQVAFVQLGRPVAPWRSEEHTSELKSLMSDSYDVLCLK